LITGTDREIGRSGSRQIGRSGSRRGGEFGCLRAPLNAERAKIFCAKISHVRKVGISMALVIYLDDNIDDDELIARLRKAGYGVVSPRQAGTSGCKDLEHLAYAAEHGYVLLTADAKEFAEKWHKQWLEEGRSHAGILVIHYERDVSKNMSYEDIIRAIDNLVAAGMPLDNEVYSLNQWRYRRYHKEGEGR